MSETSLEERVKVARSELELGFKDFHELLKSKVLDSNKSAAVKNTEKQIVDKLYRAALKLEDLNVGEGVMSLAIIAVREMLKMRDRQNDLEYKLLSQMKNISSRIKTLEERSGIKNDPKDSQG